MPHKVGGCLSFARPVSGSKGLFFPPLSSNSNILPHDKMTYINNNFSGYRVNLDVVLLFPSMQ